MSLSKTDMPSLKEKLTGHLGLNNETWVDVVAHDLPADDLAKTVRWGAYPSFTLWTRRFVYTDFYDAEAGCSFVVFIPRNPPADFNNLHKPD